MTMTTKERLLQYIEYKNISKPQFYSDLEIKRGLLDSDKLKATITDVIIAKILVKYKDLNINWLLTGKGNMLHTETEQENLPVAHPSDSPTEGIPLIPISTMAGSFTGEQTVLEYECERFVVPTFKGAEFLISVKGSSMYPRYNSGDIVACKRLPMDDLFFQWNKVYVLDTDQGPLIKRVKPGSDKEHVLIVSDNEHYEPFELPINRIYHVALVIGVIRLE